jgi:putative hydrolases of HD superfamily
MSINNHAKSILQFLRLAERLKLEMRHSWLSNGRQESVAEHTWMMALFALLTYRQLKVPINIDKALKMIIIHDLAEVEVGDIPFTEQSERKLNKQALEKAAMRKIYSMLPKEEAEEICSLWYEYEERNTPEAKFIKALDTLEAQIQHNLADLKTWEEIEFELVYTKMDQHCNHDSYLKELCDQVKLWSEGEMAIFGVNAQSVKERISSL